MSRFSKKGATTSSKTVNYMGHEAFKYDPEYELANILLTSFVQDKYYESSQAEIKRLVDVISKLKDKEFAIKAALFARHEFNMRSITHVTAAELANQVKGSKWLRPSIADLVYRPDDAIEMIAYYGNKYGKPIPNVLKRGIADSLVNFDAYQLAKYRKSTHEVKLVDVFNLVHPKPVDEKQNKLWRDFINGDLKPAKTWETKLSAAGQTGDKDAKEEAWDDLINSGKIGYMALLRNLRNIIQECGDKTIKKACKIISDPKRVRNSKQFPFRFLSAFEALSTSDGKRMKFEKDSDSPVFEALSDALMCSIDNLPLLKGKTVILCDNSGSMTGDGGGGSLISSHSNIKTSDIGNLFAVLYWMRCDNTYVGLFGDRLIEPEMDRDKDVFENFDIVNKARRNCGGSTETGIFTALEKLIEEKQIVDHIVIFSDCQIGTGCQWYDTGTRRGDSFNRLWQRYRKISPDVKVYTVDLRGYGTTVFKEGVYKISGWSEKIFQIMEYGENLVDIIKNYEVPKKKINNNTNKPKKAFRTKRIRKG